MLRCPIGETTHHAGGVILRILRKCPGTKNEDIVLVPGLKYRLTADVLGSSPITEPPTLCVV